MDNGLCICRDDVALFIAFSTDYHYYHTGKFYHGHRRDLACETETIFLFDSSPRLAQ